MRKKISQRITAGVMCVALVMGMMAVPDVCVKAAATDIKEYLEANSEHSDMVTAELADSGSSVGEYHEYTVSVMNHLDEAISDWLIVIPMTEVESVQDWTAWATVQAYYTEEYLLVAPVGEKVIPAGMTYGKAAGDGSAKINYTGKSTPENISVYFKRGNAATGVFEEVLNNAGDGNFAGDEIGEIDTSIEYNFAKLLQYSLYFYDANMCGDEVEDKSLYSKTKCNGWRGNCHVNDSFRYEGKEYSAVGGFHDAGDSVKFGLPLGSSMTTLGISYLEFKEAFDELGQAGHLQTITDYYCDYVRRCTVLDEEGVAEAFCYQVGCGDMDHRYWGAPEEENEDATNREMTLIATSENPATDIVGATVAALTLNYLNFGNEEDLSYAKALFAFAMNNEKRAGEYEMGEAGAFYISSAWEDEYCLAAALLYKATEEEKYKTEYVNYNQNGYNLSKSYGWADAYQAAALYSPVSNEEELKIIGDYLSGVAEKSTDKYLCEFEWGSARVNCNIQFIALMYDKYMGEKVYQEWAKYQMSTILGNNERGINLICGYNENSPKKPHHRAASGYSGWTTFNEDGTQLHTLYGALCGGPKTSSFWDYTDTVKDAVCNEVACDYNAGLVGASAALYLAYRESDEPGFANQSVDADFYGGENYIGTEGEEPKEDTEGSSEESTEGNSEESTEGSSEESTEGNSEESTEGDSEESTEENSEESTEENSEESTEGNSEESTEGSSEESTEGNSEESTEGSSEESTEENSEESTEGNSEESTEGSSEDSTEGNGEESTEGSSEESTEGSTEGSTEDSIENSTESQKPEEENKGEQPNGSGGIMQPEAGNPGTSGGNSDTSKKEPVIEKPLYENPITGVKNSYKKTIGSKSFALKAKGKGTITYQSSNKKAVTINKTTGKVKIKGIGKAVITITASGNAAYKLSVSYVTIQVTPKKQKIRSVRRIDGQTLLLKWKKDKKAKGYQVQYSVNQKFKNAKTITIKKAKTDRLLLKGLKRKKKYYIRVRAYGKDKVYGNWSKKRTVKM